MPPVQGSNQRTRVLQKKELRHGRCCRQCLQDRANESCRSPSGSHAIGLGLLAFNYGCLSAPGCLTRAHGPSGVFAAGPISCGSLVEVTSPALLMADRDIPSTLRPHAFPVDDESQALLVPLGWGLLIRDVSDARPSANVAWDARFGDAGTATMRLWARRDIHAWEELVVARCEPGDDLPGPSPIGSHAADELLPTAVRAAWEELHVAAGTASPARGCDQAPSLCRAPRLSVRSGSGAFASQAFAGGEILGSWPAVPLPSEEVAGTALAAHALQIPMLPTLVLLPLGSAGVIGRSSQPNVSFRVEVDRVKHFFEQSTVQEGGCSLSCFRVDCQALVDIRTGEEVVISPGSQCQSCPMACV